MGRAQGAQSPEMIEAPEQSPFLLSPSALLSLSLLQDQELVLACSQLMSCTLLEAFRNCQRGKADFVCSYSSPGSVILHYCITVLKAKHEKSEEWIPVTFKSAMVGVICFVSKHSRLWLKGSCCQKGDLFLP